MSILCCAAVLFHIEKIKVVWKENVPLSSLLVNRTFILVFVFLILSIIMFCLKESGVKSFTEPQVNSFLG